MNTQIVKTLLPHLARQLSLRAFKIRATLGAGKTAPPPDPKAVETMAARAEQVGRRKDAIALYWLIFLWYPKRMGAALKLLRLLDETDAELEPVALTAAQRFPDRIEPREALALVAQKRGAALEAARIWAQLAQERPDRLRYQRRKALAVTQTAKAAEALGKKGNVSQAESDLRAALEMLGPDERLLQTLARLRHQDGQYVESAEAWNAWAALGPTDQPTLWQRAGRTFSIAGLPGRALEAFETALAQGADPAQINKQRASLLEKLHRWGEAEALYEGIAATAPENERILIGLVRCLAERDPDTAEARLNQFSGDREQSFALLRARILVAHRRLDYDAALTLWRQATELFPDKPAAWAGLAQSYTARFETSKARKVCAERPDLESSEPIQVARAEISIAERHGHDADKEIDTLEALHGSSLRTAQLRVRRLQLIDKLDEAAACLAEAVAGQAGAIKPICDLAVLYIRAGRNDAARNVIDGILPEYDSRTDVAELRSWVAAHYENIEVARRYWTPEVARGFPALRPLEQELHPSRPVPTPARVQLFAFFRNERNRLAYFLDHYRRLGVERFYIVDNGSDDGSTEFLVNQDDVWTFCTEQSYRDAVSGMRWINHLVERYGGTGWSLHADVDEFLVLPGLEGRVLQDYLPYLEQNGFEAVRAFLLDMYPERAVDAQAYQAGENPRLRCPFFDYNYRVYGGHRAPYAMVEGGMRERLFSQYGLHQNKTPLVRAGLGIHFLASSHFISPARVADVTGAMLHYKFLGAYRDRLTEEAKRRQYSNAAKNIVQLNSRISNTPEGMAWTGGDSRIFASSRQLLEMGLLKDGGLDLSEPNAVMGDKDHAQSILETAPA